MPPSPSLLHGYLLVGALLFGLGVVGFLTRRNMIVMFLCAEMMLQGVSLSLVAWGRYHNDWGGQTLVIFILTIAACEAGIALALVLALFQRTGSLDIALWNSLREEGLPPHVDQELPEEALISPQFPRLTPAGRLPEESPEEGRYREHV